MDATMRRIQYFYVTTRDAPGEAYQFLSSLASSQVNLLAFSAVPTGPSHAQMTLFPDEPGHLVKVAARLGIHLDGPYHAFLVQGDDRLGAFAEVHRRLSEDGINVFSSNGVTDGRGGFGYLIYVRGEDFDRAARVLGV